jgi:glycosyltransferase involved in cell wall biosynthesis
MKKRIIHLLATNSYSGAENVVINIVTSMSDEYEFAYASPKGPIEKILADNNIVHIPINSMNPYYLNSIFRQWKPDIIHGHDFRTSINSALSFYPCIKISHLHQNPTWMKGVNLYSIAYSMTSLIYDRVVVVSSEILVDAVFSSIVRKKSVVIQNNVDIKMVVEQSINGDCNDDYDIVFIGRLTDVKDPLRFIKLIKKIIVLKPDIKAVMIGDGDLKNECEKKIKDLNLEKHIKLKGFLSNPYSVLKSAKLLVMTSRWEGFGLVAVEAMALGKPVVAAPVGGLKTIINEDCGGFCESDEEYIAKIIEILNNNSYYKYLSDNAIIQAQKFGDKEKWMGELNNLYNQLI